MNVLFVSSGNSKLKISPIVKKQGESLIDMNINVDFFTISGKGFWGYLKNIYILNRFLKNKKYDVIHAHYSLSAFVASLSFRKPLVVSLMGSDVKSSGFYKLVIKIFHIFFWQETIVKSEDMKKSLGFNNVLIIPNGVDLNIFRPMNKKECLLILNWDTKKKHILFPSDPERPEKNFSLFMKTVNNINDKNIEIHYLNDVSHEEVPIYLNASDVIFMTSIWEGSPNSIKEAMACNRPIVSTNVGDVKWLLSKVDGCFVGNFDHYVLASLVRKALKFSEASITNGRHKIDVLGLSSETIAKKIINVYHSVINL